MSDPARPRTPPEILIARAVGWRAEQNDELIAEIREILDDPTLTKAQKVTLTTPRTARVDSLLAQLERLMTVQTGHIAGMSDEDAVTYLLRVAVGAQRPVPLPIQPEGN